MNVKLPINLLPEIPYECWTYQRMAILRTCPKFNEWFVHHLNNQCITSEYDCDFGRFDKKCNICPITRIFWRLKRSCIKSTMSWLLFRKFADGLMNINTPSLMSTTQNARLHWCNFCGAIVNVWLRRRKKGVIIAICRYMF